MLINIMSDKTELEIYNLIKKRDDKYSMLCNLQENIRLIKKDIEHINKKLKVVCNHDWVSLDSGGSYSESYYICKICNISK